MLHYALMFFMTITADTKMRLLADSDVPALDVNVDTFNGTVTLWGSVPTQQAKAAAEADARRRRTMISSRK